VNMPNFSNPRNEVHPSRSLYPLTRPSDSKKNYPDSLPFIDLIIHMHSGTLLSSKKCRRMIDGNSCMNMSATILNIKDLIHSD